ncbi:MAG: RNA polymerase sigma factor [Thermoguttaceae bacterium]
MSGQTILQRVGAGDPSAIDECLARYGALVWSLVRRHVSNHADAEDAAQDAFIAIWQSASRYEMAMGAETTFITTIVRRRLIDRHRKQGRQRDTAPLEERAVAGAENHTREVEVSDEAALVRRRMSELRPEERRVLELAVSEGLSQSEIAEATSMPLGTVKTHARRGLNRLRQLLDVSTGPATNGPTEARS